MQTTSGSLDAVDEPVGVAGLGPAELLQLCHGLTERPIEGTLEMHLGLAQRCIRLGELLAACDVAVAGQKRWPEDVALRRLEGLALARMGATKTANDRLRELYDRGCRDPETVGIYARTLKDLSSEGDDHQTPNDYLAQAHRLYRQAYQSVTGTGKERLDDAIYTGINTASTALQLGRTDLARSMAREVDGHCLTRLSLGNDYWATASRAEAALILKEWPQAQELYQEASGIGRKRYSDQCATRQQARKLLERLGRDKNSLDTCFLVPTVLVFAGHMIDKPGRFPSRFPARLEGRVRKEIAACLARFPEKIGFSGAACGADLLFLEEMLEQDGAIHVVLPFRRDVFVATSVGSWLERFNDALAKATDVITANQHREGASLASYTYSNLIRDGLARLRAAEYDTDLVPLVVWDRRPGDGPGGAAASVDHWRSQGLEPEVVDLSRMLAEDGPCGVLPLEHRPASPTPAVLSPPPVGFSEEIKSILFADVAHYSRISEERIPHFVASFMGTVSNLIESSPLKPAIHYTWGDGLYLAFDSVKGAAEFAFALQKSVLATDWSTNGLPSDLSVRIALHAGPVFDYKDPVTRQRNYTGRHVTWAARIEPKTEAGQIFASLPFASLAAAEGLQGMTFVYVGQYELSKGYGLCRLYRVEQTRGAAVAPSA